MKKHALDMGNSKSFSQRLRHQSGLESPPKNLHKLCVQASDAQLLKIDTLVFEQLGSHKFVLALDGDSTPSGGLKEEGGLVREHALLKASLSMNLNCQA